MANLHQVFVGCPFTKTTRPYYEKLKKEVEAETPLRIVLADTPEVSAASPLLEHITCLIRESAACIFDVTGSNANVALELGIAHAVPVQYAITVKPRVPRKTGSKTTRSSASSIIADLRGRRRIEYKNYRELKKELSKKYFPTLTFYKRWSAFKRRRRAHVPYALEVFQEIRAHGHLESSKLAGIVDNSGIEAKALVQALKEAKLIEERRRGERRFYYPTE